MDLFLTRLSFRNFRSYETFYLDDIGPLTIFVGRNAVGKTNIIEGIQLLTAQSSFRNPLVCQIPHNGAAGAYLMTEITDKNRLLSLELHIENNKKKYFLNHKPKRAVDLKGIIPSVTFTPDDLNIVKGPMSVRRSALDSLGTQLSKNHYLIKKDYEKILQHKNRLLKDESPAVLIESINDMVVTCGSQLTCYRAALCKKLFCAMREFYAELTNKKELLDMSYIPSWQSDDTDHPQSYAFDRAFARTALSAALKKNAEKERIRHKSLIGPHADRIEFYINGKNATIFGSQGQKRSIVLAFKLAEVSLIQDILHQKPVLLLDDVMSELDALRSRALLSFIMGDIQTFITTTTLSYFDNDLLSRACIIHLEDKPHFKSPGLCKEGFQEEIKEGIEKGFKKTLKEEVKGGIQEKIQEESPEEIKGKSQEGAQKEVVPQRKPQGSFLTPDNTSSFPGSYKERNSDGKTL